MLVEPLSRDSDVNGQALNGQANHLCFPDDSNVQPGQKPLACDRYWDLPELQPGSVTVSLCLLAKYMLDETLLETHCHCNILPGSNVGGPDLYSYS